jgi:proliferating cell nuclear antigen PCNA
MRSKLISFSAMMTFDNMEFTIKDAGLFRIAVDGLKEFLPQAQLRVSAEGVRINGMDKSHVGFVDYFLSAADMSTVKITAPTVVGVDMGTLARVLGAVGSGDQVHVAMKRGADKITVSYANTKANKKAMFEIPLLTIDDEPMALPELTYAAKVSAKTGDVFTVIKEVAPFGDTITLALDDTGFHISTKGDMGSAQQTLESTDDRDMELTEDSVTSTFGTKYLLTIMKCCSGLSVSTTLEFDNQPLRATFRFGEGSYFIAYLAPKVMDA